MNRKQNLKKWLLVVTLVLIAFMAIGYFLLRTLYLPGVHFIGGYCSINETFTCYWCDEETKEFTGETSEIFLKANGFGQSSKWMNGTLEIGGYEMEREYENASDATGKLYYYQNVFPGFSQTYEFHYAEISYADYYIEYVTNESTGVSDSKPAKGYEYQLYFCKESTDCLYVVVLDENREIERIGYCADSLEEAKEAWQTYWTWE